MRALVLHGESALGKTCKDLPNLLFLLFWQVEQDIINFSHTYRGDISDYVIRSSEPRIKFKENSILPRKQKYTAKKGDILIDNDNYPRYKGELSIALKKFDIDDRTNVVGHLVPEHHYLLDYIQPWEKFKFQKDN